MRSPTLYLWIGYLKMNLLIDKHLKNTFKKNREIKSFLQVKFFLIKKNCKISPETDVALEFLRYVHMSSSLLQLFTALESLFMLGIMAFNEGQNDLVSHNKIL